MNLSRFIVTAAASILVSAAISNATTISECQTDIANLKTDTEQAAITGRNAEKDRAGLIGKLDNAATALDKAKFCDATQKLNDFRTKVNLLVAAGAIDVTTGQQLLAGADAAIACIRDVAGQAGTSCP